MPSASQLHWPPSSPVLATKELYKLSRQAHFQRSKPPPQADAMPVYSRKIKAAGSPQIAFTRRATNKGQEIIIFKCRLWTFPLSSRMPPAQFYSFETSTLKMCSSNASSRGFLVACSAPSALQRPRVEYFLEAPEQPDSPPDLILMISGNRWHP